LVILYDMNIEDRYKTRNFYPVGVNLTRNHYQFLRELANTKFNRSISDAIQYLISKYQRHLNEIRITPYKRTETANYQPKTKQYIRYKIRINPALWSKLFDSRRFIGYSMSALLRIMLDWEMQEKGREIDPLIEMPELPIQDEPHVVGNETIQNYVYTKTAEYTTRKIFSIFWDQFY
jgi:hypothetical protein